MGSTTWNDPHMPRPLPKRTNVLVTSKLIDHPEATHVISGNLVTELQLLKNQYAQQTIWVIGGPNIVNQCLSCIEEFYISRIPGFHSCDTFLPIDRIETMFELDWYQEHPTVRFEIWKNLDSQN